MQRGASVEVDGLGTVVGDVAWGGNWFFLVDRDGPGGHGRELAGAHLRELSDADRRVALESLRPRGCDGRGTAPRSTTSSSSAPAQRAPTPTAEELRLCAPAAQYDRSPCGTGTSAKLACLAADGALAPGQPWIQESIIGSRFEAVYRPGDSGRIIPTITGSAYICSEGTLIQQPDDPFRSGIPPADA